MGVCGSGKSTVGEALSRASGLTYIDGDDLHPESNVEKMRTGLPLNDLDRAPWLAACGRSLAERREGLILGCSALKASYRHLIRANAKPAEPTFIYLHGTRALLRARLEARRDHFMPSALLDSQLETLDPPSPSEGALTVSIEHSPDAIAEHILSRLAGRSGSVAQIACAG
ncbi:gluconokinase [Thioclava sp. NG1]|nr:gluconokinase [Thioclava sp. NG1]